MAKTKTPRLSARERILSAASTLFYTEGMQNVGIDRIIAESGVAKMSLYNNFKSKDDLITAYIERFGEKWQAFLSDRLEALATEPKDKLVAVFDVLQEWSSKPDYRGCPFINSIVELANPEHPGFQVALSQKQALVDSLTQLAIAAELKNPELLGQQLFILVEGSLVISMRQKDSGAIAAAKQAAKVLIES